MAGGLVKYRHLSRNSAHRQALLRNLVTSLVRHESIRTTWAKAKETQRLADKLITLAKRNNETARRKATGILYVRAVHPPHPPDTALPRPGGADSGFSTRDGILRLANTSALSETDTT